MASRNEVFKLTIDVDAEIKNARAAAESLQKSFSKINLSDSIRNNLNKTFSNLEKELTNFETMTSKPFKNMGDVQKAEKSFENITNLFDQLKVTAKNVQGMDLEKIMPKDFVRQLDRVKDLYKTVTKEAIEAGKEQQKAASNAKKAIADQNKELKELQKTQKELEDRQQQHQSDRELLSGNYKGRAAALKGNVTKAQNQVEATKEGTVARDIAENEAKNAQKIYNDYIKSIVEAQQREKEWANTHKETEAKLKEVNSAIEQANNKIKEQEAIMNAAAESPASLEKLREALSAISGQDLSQIPTNLKDINEMVATLQADKMREVAEQVGVLASEAEKTDAPLKVMDERIKDVHNSGEQLTETASEVERLGDRIRYFFSIGNSIRLFKRAIHDAMNTVKELDKAMTETATVTDFSISDMWEQLPRYTEEANKLGTSINSLYKATTLYYQQGLDTNEAMALGVETIKMARVASMDAADATDLMTAALRGFNMELNETSAVRVNDVYSELAAVTAADTDEIGIAISKTASIAHSANMEFETTAAFLSQIIETTREAPETAGTAMKTIVARFSEVKKLYSEGQITGTDEEGEVVNVNKIQEALRTVGIDMSKFFTGKEGLDQILLRLAEKWDTLDVVTQRYIATQAAGSRQQSRFLAMMSDYDRTLELVDAAYNSAGSGQRQFEKTLDSMEAKLAELKNAWDEFVMGIANSDLLKGFIDILTNILGTINKLLNTISGGNGLVKTIASLGASFLALRTGAKIFGEKGKGGGFIGSIFKALKGKDVATQMSEAGEYAAENFNTGFKGFISSGFNTKGLGASLKQGITGLFAKTKTFFTNELGSNDIEKVFQGIYGDKDLKFDFNSQQELLNTEGYRKQIEDLGYTVTEVDGKFKVFSKNTGVNLRAVGMAVTALGAGITAWGDKLEKEGKEAGTIIKSIGTTITIVGGAVTLLGGSFTKAGIEIGKAGAIAKLGWAEFIPILLLIVGLVAAITAAINNTPEKRLERAQKKAEESAKAAQEAQQAYDDLLSNRNNYNELEEKVKSLTKGTEEWKDAVAELNSKVLELIQNYEGLEIEYDSEGNMSISKESWDKVEQQQKTKTDKATATALSDRINAAQTKVNVAKNNASAVGSDGQVYEDWELRSLRSSMGQISDEDWEDYLKSQEIKIVPTVDLSEANKELEIARKNMILAFMPESVDKKEANQVGKALTTLIGDAIDDETDPDTIQGIVDKYYAGYNKLTDEQKALLAGDFSKIESGSVAFNDETREALVKATGRTKEEIDTIISDAQKEYKAKLEETNKELERLGLGNLDVFGDKETGMTLADKTRDMGFQDARAYVRAWKEVAADNPELAKDLLNFDTSNLSGVVNTIQTMIEKGIDQTKIDNYWKAATAGANNFEIKLSDILNTAKAAQEELKGIAELGERMGKGTMTDEDVMQYLSHGGNMDNLMWTAEGWQLVGESAEEAMKRERAALLQEQEIELKVLKDRQENLKNAQTNDEKAQALGIKKSDFTNEEGIFETAEDFDRYIEAIQKAEEELPQLIDIQDKVVAGMNAIQNSADQNALMGKGPEAVRQAARQEVSDAGLDTQEFEAYSEQLQKITAESEDMKAISQEMADRIALDNMKMNASIQELGSNWEEWNQALSGDRGAPEYSKALTSLRNNMKSMLGISSDLSEEFLTDAENMDLMAKAAKGDGEAIDELRKKAAKDLALGLKLDQSSVDELTGYVDQLTGQEYEIGTTLDNSQVLDSIYDMLVAAGATTDQIQEYFDNLGWEPQFETESYTLKDSDVRQGYVEVPSGYDAFGAPTGTRQIPLESSMQAGAVIQIPKVRGKNSHVSGTYKGSAKATANASNGGKKSGGGGGGGSKKQDNWKNPYDKYYNLTEKINEALRTREKIERDYDRILKRRERTAAELLKNSAQEIANLRQEVEYQKRLQAGRREQIQNIAGERYDNGDQRTTFEKMGVTKYANYNFDTQTIEIDWAAIEAVRDEELGKAIEAYVGRLEELQGQYEETQDTIEEMEDNIWEINQRGKEEYLSFEQRVLDALIAADQKIIDDLSAKFEGINSANDKILNSMQEQIDLERQIRDNTKTEDDIAQKEARLAYLRRDTSGANATEIMKLEQELADARQNYTDTLIDQGLQKLSDENQRAAEQRQEQIDIMQSIHDWTVESGGFNEKANELINEAATAGEVTEAIKILLQENDGWTSMTKFAGEKWMTDLANEYKAAMEGLSNFKEESARLEYSKNDPLTLESGEKVWFDDTLGRWIDAANNLYDIQYNTATGGYTRTSKTLAKDADSNAWLKDYLDQIKQAINSSGAGSSSGTGSGSGSNTSSGSGGGGGGNPTKYKFNEKIGDYTFSGSGYTSKTAATAALRTKVSNKMKALSQSSGYWDANQWVILSNWYNQKTDFTKYIKAYKTGGLNTQTGPAWLDGTKTHPELVLNARDTENFIQLKDILSGMGSLDKLQNGGDNYYNFDIKVDQLASDYDVDKLIGKIKNEIDKDARYRNVNSINFIR